MKGSIAERVRSTVERKRVPGFVRALEFDAPHAAVEAELARLARAHRLRRVRNGLYWVGPRTALGIAAPDPELVALEVAGRGSGPAGIEAARWLGLTTQVPGRPVYAVAGRVPSPVDGVTFTARSPRRRELGLRPLEVAAIEVLRDFPTTVEVGWRAVANAIVRHVNDGTLRPSVLRSIIRTERHPGLRERWSLLESVLAVSP